MIRLPAHRPPAALVPMALALLLGACAQPQPPAAGPSSPALSAGDRTPTGPVVEARLVTAEGRPAGQARFTTVRGGVLVDVQAEGLTPGAHGMHVHMHGECTPGPDAATGQVVAFGAAGGHFDPGSSHRHGRPLSPIEQAHGGDLPMLQAGADGRAEASAVHPELRVASGPASVMGRTLVVHAQADDMVSNPAGNSGARVLCGLIGPRAGEGVVSQRVSFEGAQVFPEGIALDRRDGTLYAGSSANGDLFRVRPGAARAELLQAGGSPGRQGAFGMKLDERGRLWVAGGPQGTVALVDPAGGATLAVFKLPPTGPSHFLNDLALAGDGQVYVTDSFHPVLWRVRNAGAGTAVALEPWLDLTRTPVRYVPGQINLNGIVAAPDGPWLLAVQLVTGQLWRIDTRTRAVTEVAVEGSPLQGADGLVLRGRNELVVLRNESREVVRLSLDDQWSRARVAQRLTDPRLRYPTTAALAGERLWVVNSQLDRQKAPPPVLPFDLVAIELK